MNCTLVCVLNIAASTFQWGGASVDLRYSDAGAEVLFHNEMAQSSTVIPMQLESDGLIVDVLIVNGMGEEPDTMVVTPPTGWIAVPPSIEVEEGQTGTVTLLQELMG